MDVSWEVSLHPESTRDEGIESMSGPSLTHVAQIFVRKLKIYPAICCYIIKLSIRLNFAFAK